MKINQQPADLIQMAQNEQLHVRCSLLVNKAGIKDIPGIIEYVKQAGELGANAVVVREVWVPDYYSKRNTSVFRWNKNNYIDIKPLEKEFIDIASCSNEYGLASRAPLPWGTPVFAMGDVFSDDEHGVNITFACCDEAVYSSTMKSIVHKPNGHGYRNWDHNGDILY